MIPKECKRLAEVDFPIAVVSRHAAREKSIRHGHPSTLHLWWARRPLASCRAVLLGLLIPDPCDRHCPEPFKKAARNILGEVRQPPKTDEELRKALLWFIGSFADWDMAANRTYLRVARELVKAAHPEETPLVVDPFAGGGSIPLEALRLGCENFASDLNPVACLILKVLLEDIPRHGSELAEELRRVGAEIRQAAERELSELYPADPDGSRPIAYLWARTVRCESPNCGAEIPLLRSFWLCKKANRRRALRYKVVRPKGETPLVELDIFEPRGDREVPAASVSRAKAACLCCNMVLAPERVRAQLAAQRGGADVVFNNNRERIGGARLLAVVTLKSGEQGRHYRLAAELDYQAVRKAMQRLEDVAAKPLRGGLSPVPDEPLPPIGTLGFRVQRYGMLQWGDLFTARQKLGLHVFAQKISKSSDRVRTLLALALGKMADLGNAAAPWKRDAECPVNLLGSQRLRPPWEWAEAVFTGDAAASFESSYQRSAAAISASLSFKFEPGSVGQGDAMQATLPDSSASVWFTDPPYYDAIPYADLSDFFFVWLKRALPEHPLLRDPYDSKNALTPKEREIVQDHVKKVDGQPKDKNFFESSMNRAFTEGRRVSRADGVGSVVFAHKTTEGWEALLSGLTRGGWKITSSWPIATEMAHRPRARESAALATSVHLVCRPRGEDTPVGDWTEVLRELPQRVGDWMERLQSEGVRGADLVFACIGPALEIFSRYSRVETAEGREVTLAEYLEKVWEVVGRTALEQVLGTPEARARNSAAGAIEEDARLTALFLWTLQTTNRNDAEEAGEEHEEDDAAEEDEQDDDPKQKKKGYVLIYDVVRRFAQPLGIHLDAWKGRIIEIEKGVVRLLPVTERAHQLFGKEGARGIAERFERVPTAIPQLLLFPLEAEKAGRGESGRRKKGPNARAEAPKARHEATTLDRVHMAMLLQASGQANALRALLRAEQERSPGFLRLANALSALYPKSSEEKRLLDAMLLTAPRS